MPASVTWFPLMSLIHDLFRPVGEDIQERGSNYCIADEDLMSTSKADDG